MALTKKNLYKQKNYKIEFSFDDGSIHDLKVVDILNKLGVKGVFYIIVDKVGKNGYLDWDQVKEIDRQGHTIGSHTISHPPDMKALYEEDLYYETQNAKEMLETVLGHTVSRFCYPRGRCDERVKAMVMQAGYVDARGTGRTGVTDDTDKFYLPGTVHIFQREEYGDKNIVEYAKDVVDKVKERNEGYINIWGHSWEIDRDGNWKVLEEVIRYAIA